MQLWHRNGPRFLHLDWHPLEAWLLHYPHLTVMAWRDEKLVAVIGLSNEPSGSYWVRLMLAQQGSRAYDDLATLWHGLVVGHLARPPHDVHVLAGRFWVENLLGALGFEQTETLVSYHASLKVPDTQPLLFAAPDDGPVQTILHQRSDLRVLAVDAAGDWQSVLTIDNDAFAAPWQLTGEEMRQALRLAYRTWQVLPYPAAGTTAAGTTAAGTTAAGTIADDTTAAGTIADDTTTGRNGATAPAGVQPIAYALLNRNEQRVHVSRLAVVAAMQGRSIGRWLLQYVMAYMAERRIRTLSLNTQVSNLRSRHLYEAVGFRETGDRLPIMTFVAGRMETASHPPDE